MGSYPAIRWQGRTLRSRLQPVGPVSTRRGHDRRHPRNESIVTKVHPARPGETVDLTQLAGPLPVNDAEILAIAVPLVPLREFAIRGRRHEFGTIEASLTPARRRASRLHYMNIKLPPPSPRNFGSPHVGDM